MPSSGIVAIDPSNNATAVIDASNLSAVPKECPTEQRETAEELSQQDDDQAVSPMPLKKAPMVTPRTDRKVTTSTSGGSSSANAAPLSHTPEPSKGKSKKKVAVATPVAAEESSSPKKSKKSSKANSVPMKTMKHFFGKAGTAKAKKDNAKPSAANIHEKKDDNQAKKGVDTSTAERADSKGDDASKAEAKIVGTTKKSKAKTKSKPKQLPQNTPAAKKTKAAPKSSVDIIDLEDMDDSPMDALAIVSRNMSAGRRSRVTVKSALEGQKIEKASNSTKAKDPLASDKEATIAPKNTPKTDEIVNEVKESTSSSTADNDGKESVVGSSKGRVEDISECDDDATVALDDSGTPAAIESDIATSVEKHYISDSPVDEVGCTEEVTVEVESDKGICTEEKQEESCKGQPAVIFIDEPTPETETPKKDDSTNTAEVAPSKKKRDPNAPKKPKSALNLYQIAKRNEFKAANPDTKAGEITKLMSAEYKKLDAKDKLVWEEQAKEDKLRYKNEMAAYKPSEPPSSPKNDDTTATAKEPSPKKEKSPILIALAACPPKSKGDKSSKVQTSSNKKAASISTPKATSDPKPALSEEERSHLQKLASLSEKYNLRAEQLKSRPASDDFTEESLTVENADLPLLEKGSVEVDGIFPDQLLSYLMVVAQGSALPLSTLSKKALQELSVFVHESHPLTLELVSSKIKLLAQRKSFLNAPSHLDCFENDEEGYMWRWELSSIDLLPSKDAAKVKKARTARKKLQSHHKAVINLISAIEKAVSSIEAKSSSSPSQKLIAKVSDMEEKVLKFEREEETARLLNKAKAQKQAADNAKKEEEKERKKIETAKEREAAKQKKAEEKEKEKLAKQQELEEKENKRKARMMSFFSKGSAKKKQKLSSTPTLEDSVACKENSLFDSDSLRRLINSQSKHSSTPFAKAQRKRKTQNVRVSVFVTTMSDNPFSQQPYDEEKIITVPNVYKFLGFHEDVRPPYHGTWSKTSSIVTGRNPFGQDKSILDYEVDSEAEWEEGDDDQGEDLNEDVGEEEEDEAPQDEDSDGWLAAEDDLGIDDEDEETKALRKRKLHLEANLQKSGHYKACVVAPQMGGIPHSAECEITLVEGFSPANAFDVLCTHVGCVLSPDIDSICLDAFAPTDSAKNSDQTNDSSTAQSDEMTSEAKKIVAQFVHNCTVNSKDKLVTELLKAHPSITKSRAKAMREVDFMAEKKKVPKEAGGGVLWKVKPDLLKTLGLEEKDLKQPPKVAVPQKVQDAEANRSPMAQTGTKSVENTLGTKKKKKRDPNAPKKPKSSFMYFSNAKRAEVKAANPDASFGDIGKLLGNEWKQLSNDAKTEFEGLAEADKKRYQKEMEDYSPPLDDSASTEEAGEKKKVEVKRDQSLKKENSKSTPSPNSTKRKTPPVSVASANLFAAFLKKKKTE